MGRHKKVESIIDGRLTAAVSLLPKKTFEFSKILSLLEDHGVLLSEMENQKLHMEERHYQQCLRLITFDAAVLALWMTKTPDPSEPFPLKNLCRSLQGVNKKLRALEAPPKYSDVFQAFNNIVRQASEFFVDHMQRKQLNILAQMIGAYYNSETDQSPMLDKPEGQDPVCTSYPENDHLDPDLECELQETVCKVCRSWNRDDEKYTNSFSQGNQSQQGRVQLEIFCSSIDQDVPCGNLIRAIKSIFHNETRAVSDGHLHVENANEDTNGDAVLSISPNTNTYTGIVWTHVLREPISMGDQVCFICKTDNEETGSLQNCGKENSSGRCTTLFHISCLKTFNAGDYKAEYLKQLAGQYQCPLHHCDSCWQDRRKSSAVYGTIIECAKCYRGYHSVCLPAGLHIFPDGDSKKTVCHTHFDSKIVAACSGKRGFPFCFMCEKRDKGLKRCSICVQSFHEKCRRVKIVRGNRYKNYESVCESCIDGESVKPLQPVICRYGTGIFAAEAVSLQDYPDHCASLDKFGKYLGEPGFIPVKWSACQNLFSLLPACHVMPMFVNSLDVCRPNNKDKDFKEAWKQLEQTIRPIRPNFNIKGEPYGKIKTSVYHGDSEQPRLLSEPVDQYLCDCADKDEDRCSLKSSCTARALQQECPKACHSYGKCNNRSVSEQRIHPHIETRETLGKGDGVFAIGIIKKGEHIAEYAGEIISRQEQKRRIELSSEAQNDEEKHYMMELDSTRVIDCKYKGNIARFINHSCDPNCKVELVSIEVVSSQSLAQFDIRPQVVAMRDISAGEEVSFSYDMVGFSADCPLPECLCNAPNCRGTLGRSSIRKNLVAQSVLLPKKESDVTMSRKRGRSASSTVRHRKQIKLESAHDLDSSGERLAVTRKRAKTVAAPGHRVINQECEAIDLLDDISPQDLQNMTKQEPSRDGNVTRNEQPLTNFKTDSSSPKDYTVKCKTAALAIKIEPEDPGLNDSPSVNNQLDNAEVSHYKKVPRSATTISEPLVRRSTRRSSTSTSI